MISDSSDLDKFPQMTFLPPSEMSGFLKECLQRSAPIPEGFVLYGKGPMVTGRFSKAYYTGDVRYLDKTATDRKGMHNWGHSSYPAYSDWIYAVREGSPTYGRISEFLEPQGKEVIHDF